MCEKGFCPKSCTRFANISDVSIVLIRRTAMLIVLIRSTAAMLIVLIRRTAMLIVLIRSTAAMLIALIRHNVSMLIVLIRSTAKDSTTKDTYLYIKKKSDILMLFNALVNAVQIYIANCTISKNYKTHH